MILESIVNFWKVDIFLPTIVHLTPKPRIVFQIIFPRKFINFYYFLRQFKIIINVIQLLMLMLINVNVNVNNVNKMLIKC
jgi:hypothetical protein